VEGEAIGSGLMRLAIRFYQSSPPLPGLWKILCFTMVPSVELLEQAPNKREREVLRS
jgi:hypothetical protein